MNTPLVSIVVPCYNYGHFLGQTLRNVQAQDYANWECIIVDDGSTDDTRSVAKGLAETDNRFHYVYQDNKGLSAARNTGIDQSRGMYLQFLDSDDLIHHSKLSRQVAMLEAEPKIDIIYGNGLFFEGDRLENLFPTRKLSRYRRPQKLQVSGTGRTVLQKLLVNNIMAVSCALIRRSLIQSVGVFDETYKSFEDWHFWIRCALHDARFEYAPAEGTETYIRIGHPSMMTDRKKLTMHGIRLRKYVNPHLDRSMKAYNFARLLRLYARKTFKIY